MMILSSSELIISCNRYKSFLLGAAKRSIQIIKVSFYATIGLICNVIKTIRTVRVIYVNNILIAERIYGTPKLISSKDPNVESVAMIGVILRLPFFREGQNVLMAIAEKPFYEITAHWICWNIMPFLRVQTVLLILGIYLPKILKFFIIQFWLSLIGLVIIKIILLFLDIYFLDIRKEFNGIVLHFLPRSLVSAFRPMQ